MANNKLIISIVSVALALTSVNSSFAGSAGEWNNPGDDVNLDPLGLITNAPSNTNCLDLDNKPAQCGYNQRNYPAPNDQPLQSQQVRQVYLACSSANYFVGMNNYYNNFAPLFYFDCAGNAACVLALVPAATLVHDMYIALMSYPRLSFSNTQPGLPNISGPDGKGTVLKQFVQQGTLSQYNPRYLSSGNVLALDVTSTHNTSNVKVNTDATITIMDQNANGMTNYIKTNTTIPFWPPVMIRAASIFQITEAFNVAFAPNTTTSNNYTACIGTLAFSEIKTVDPGSANLDASTTNTKDFYDNFKDISNYKGNPLCIPPCTPPPNPNPVYQYKGSSGTAPTITISPIVTEAEEAGSVYLVSSTGTLTSTDGYNYKYTKPPAAGDDPVVIASNYGRVKSWTFLPPDSTAPAPVTFPSAIKFDPPTVTVAGSITASGNGTLKGSSDCDTDIVAIPTSSSTSTQEFKVTELPVTACMVTYTNTVGDNSTSASIMIPAAAAAGFPSPITFSPKTVTTAGDSPITASSDNGTPKFDSSTCDSTVSAAGTKISFTNLPPTACMVTYTNTVGSNSTSNAIMIPAALPTLTLSSKTLTSSSTVGVLITNAKSIDTLSCKPLGWSFELAASGNGMIITIQAIGNNQCSIAVVGYDGTNKPISVIDQ